RFSIIPESVYNLMNISYIRSVGKKLGIEEIKDNKDEVVFLFQNEERISQDVLKSVLKHFGRNIILKLSGKPGFGYR
ncbi:hypothetical protein HJU46_17050, partial [Clostridium butyricum]|nr:hypothetical protein [Clostridium butyricum]